MFLLTPSKNLNISRSFSKCRKYISENSLIDEQKGAIKIYGFIEGKKIPNY